MERCLAERPEQSQGSRFVAGDSFTLDGGKGRLCYGFRARGNEGLLKNAERTRRLLKKMTAFQKAEALAGQRYDRDKLLAVVDEVTTHFRLPNRFERSKMRAVCRYLADALDSCIGSTCQHRWNDLEKRYWPKWKAGVERRGRENWTLVARVLISALDRSVSVDTVRPAREPVDRAFA